MPFIMKLGRFFKIWITWRLIILKKYNCLTQRISFKAYALIQRTKQISRLIGFDQYNECFTFERFNNLIQIQMEASKSTRRTKRDPESRDFTCRCGKSYLSYAAAYTHVKQKHHLEKIYLDNIGKPERQRLPRGRPKQKKQSQKGSDVERLEIIEDTILKMFTTLKDDFPRMIIQGNDHVETDVIDAQYNQLVSELRKTYLEKRDFITEQQANFVKELNRHFTEQVAARVQMVVNVLGNLNNDGDLLGQLGLNKAVNELNILNLWRGRNEMNMLICQTLKKWKRVQH